MYLDGGETKTGDNMFGSTQKSIICRLLPLISDNYEEICRDDKSKKLGPN